MDDLITFRKAKGDDLAAIVELLANDKLGQSREDPSLPLLSAYIDAFRAIEADPNQLLAVAVQGCSIAGTLQLTFLPGIAHKGAWRGQIEAVRVSESHRSAGLGQKLFEWAIDACRARGCRLVQLTSDKTRNDAHRFYDRLGFKATHEGYKLTL